MIAVLPEERTFPVVESALVFASVIDAIYNTTQPPLNDRSIDAGACDGTGGVFGPARRPTQSPGA